MNYLFHRFFIVYWPLKIREITPLTNGISIGIAMLLSIFWALMPMFGWSYYSLEGALRSCSIEWKERSFNVISYNMSILVIVFIIPVAIIVSTNIMLLIKVSFHQDEYSWIQFKLLLFLFHYLGAKHATHDNWRLSC